MTLTLGNLKNYRKLCFIIGIFTVVILAGLIFLAYPMVSGIIATANDINNKKAMVASSDTVTNELLNMKEHYQEYESNFTALEKAFVDATNPIDFITFLETSATNNNVAIDIKLSNQQQSATGASLLNFQVSVVGSFSNVVSYIQRIEKGPYLVSIQHATIQQKVQDDPKLTTPNVIEASIGLGVVTR